MRVSNKLFPKQSQRMPIFGDWLSAYPSVGWTPSACCDAESIIISSFSGGKSAVCRSISRLRFASVIGCEGLPDASGERAAELVRFIKEREIASQSDRLKGKPAQAIEKILQGILEKFFQTYCLVDQGFVKKNSEISVKEHIGIVAKQLGDEITIRRFVRFQVGETPAA